MAYQSEPGKDVHYEKETIVRSAAGKGEQKDGVAFTAFTSTNVNSPHRTRTPTSSDNHNSYQSSNSNGGYHASWYSDGDVGGGAPSLGEYLRGFSKVVKRCMREYKEVSYDVVQSLAVLFMQHPAVGILFLVTGLFVAVPVGIYAGFAVVSFISIVVTALFVEGVLLGTGLIGLCFIVPLAFVLGVGFAVFSCASWIAVSTSYSFIRGRYLVNTTTVKTD
ncbi:hypothetical protein BV898_04689 [Hypsibius exemplaris]|uniref:Promethin n=1 Tax=Hypsibius exemplaris TaxID=2072580 RepID=A0A1W0X1X3_HYPEX|nr:hypothetical protein BV898_04689 [Hypsibius exemplaris]